MANSNLLNTKSSSYLELIGTGKTYRVPPYQRDYSWNEEQWEDLWADLLELRSGRDRIHYLGALVLEPINDREFLIVDGQQRFATLSVLSLAVVKRLQILIDSDVEPVENKQRIEQVRNRFIGEKDPSSLLEASKLRLNITDDGFYQDSLVQLRLPQSSRGIPASNRLLLQCFKYFLGKIEQTTEIKDSGARLSELLNEAVARQILFISISVDNDLNAYTVFETLNARGLELSATDLLKNYLFSKVTTKQDLKSLGRRWHKLVNTVRQDKFPEFLRFHLLCSEPKIRQQQLFKLVRDKIKSSGKVFALLEDLESRAELFAAALDPDHDYWKDVEGARPMVQALKLFGVRQHIPALFAAQDSLSKKEMVKLLRLVESFAFRYTIIGGLNPNELETGYHLVAKAMLQGGAKTASAAFKPLLRLVPSDEKFETDFAEAEIRTAGPKQKLARYILMKIEAQISAVTRDWSTDPASIEHILPEKPGKEWATVFPVDRQAEFTFRIGNLTLLERSLNRTAANKAFDKKRTSYSASQFKMTGAIHSSVGGKWGPLQVEKRQARLASLAKSIWKVAPIKR